MVPIAIQPVQPGQQGQPLLKPNVLLDAVLRQRHASIQFLDDSLDQVQAGSHHSSTGGAGGTRASRNVINSGMRSRTIL